MVTEAAAAQALTRAGLKKVLQNIPYILYCIFQIKKEMMMNKEEFLKGLIKYGKDKGFIEDKPEAGKTYTLVGSGKCIAGGNTWAESEVHKKKEDK